MSCRILHEIPLCYGAVQDGIKECKSAFPKNALIIWQS